MRIFIGLIGLAAFAFQGARAPAPAVVQDLTHFSQVMNTTRSYQALLPPAYASSQKRYPVIYWLHGYEQSSEQREAEVAKYVGSHDVIVVNVRPVETAGAFPLYFPELADHIDKTLRTIPGRDHRGVTGFSMGGFMAFWIAAKYPDLVSSASSFMGFSVASVGPTGFDVDNNLDDLSGNLDGVRTRLVTGTRDFLGFYLRRLNAIWQYSRPGYETQNFDSDHGAPGIAETLDFHMKAFANPLPKPATFSHADVFPNFGVWGWEVASDRKQPGFTVLENVSSKGFRSAVRDWIPRGAAVPQVKLSISSARLYPPGSPHAVIYIRLRDGNVRRAVQKADAQGRLNFEVDGDAYEVGFSAEPLLAVSGCEIADAAWATAGQPVKLRVKFWNKGQTRSPASTVTWESPNPGVKFDFPSGRLFALAPGESATLPVTVTVADESRAIVKIFAVEGSNRMPFEVPLFPPAEAVTNFHIADGQTLEAYQHAIQRTDVTFGEGNGDGHAAPGESFAVLLPEAKSSGTGGPFRAAEVFTNDACVDDTLRASDSWADYDHAGASASYSLPTIRANCPPGHVVHMLARVVIPNAPDHQVRYAALEFPVWWRKGEEPK
ncbi:MAG TPA: alpha/beta fold hydrolase [Bryobacteraceae bacterium]